MSESRLADRTGNGRVGGRRGPMWALLTLLAGILAACGSDDAPTPTDTGPELANPASVYCLEQGGDLEIVDEAGGQVGYCVLPDGRRIEEWEFYRAETGATTEP